jgi:AraC-like DNA-binding protein
VSVGGVVVGRRLVAAVVWTADAACAGQYELYDTAAALPLLASTQRVVLRARALTAARRICRTCEVLRRCEEASSTEENGFWAGMTEEERDTRWYAARNLGGREKTGEVPAEPMSTTKRASVKAVAVTTYSTVDHGPPLPVATSSGRTVFDDLARLEASRRLSPIQLQPITREETGALQRRAEQPWPSVVRNGAPDVEQILRLYRGGVSLRQVAAQLGCSHRTVRNQLVLAGESIRKPVVDVGRDEAIVAAYRSGATVTEIGATFGCTRWVIAKRLDKAGVTLHGRGAGLVVGAGR